jgi:hypothetical protein
MMHSLTRFICCGAVVLLIGCEETQYVHVGPNWESLQQLQPGEGSFPVEVRGPEHEAVGEKIEFSVRSQKSGSLWVVQVDPADEVSLVYPNAAAKQAPITADTWQQVPPADAAWTLEADEPLGTSIFAFIVTTGDTDISDILAQGEGNKTAMSKAVRVVTEGGAWGMAKQVLKVQK